jgi:hypothetical protein
MSAAFRRLARERAKGRCEYCRLAEESSLISFHIEHITPRQHGGVTSEDNLVLSCAMATVIEIEVAARRLHLNVVETEFTRRAATWRTARNRRHLFG